MWYILCNYNQRPLTRIIRVGCVKHAKDPTAGVFCKPTCGEQSALASIAVLRAQRTIA